jgi:UDP-glucose:(heptosyl)LPS alpha-1,3-glucosyltransferase
MAASLSAADRIHFEGPRRDTVPYFAAADVFLLPSAYETFSLAAYEAAATGLPLLVTRVSGVEEILSEGVNGWFIERDADMIRDRLMALLSDPQLRRLMGAKSRESVLQYSWSRVVDDYLSLYVRISRGSAVQHQSSEMVSVATRQ